MTGRFFSGMISITENPLKVKPNFIPDFFSWIFTVFIVDYKVSPKRSDRYRFSMILQWVNREWNLGIESFRDRTIGTIDYQPRSLSMALPIIGICPGDPAGIGPEITVKALKQLLPEESFIPVIFTDRTVLESAFRITGISLDWAMWPCGGNPMPSHEPGRVYLAEVKGLPHPEWKMGKVQTECGIASVEYIRQAVDAAIRGEIQALVTGPIHKEAIKAAGISKPGHTELLAEFSGSDDPMTMFEVDRLRIFFLTRHVSLRRACEMVTRERVYHMILKCRRALESIGIGDGILAVAGLNPHSGEHGLFGDEEERAIVPAIDQARRDHVSVIGPISADSVFHLARRDRYAAVLSLYHDQGHIAVKTLDFERTIALTLGLPFLRTSVDHGTAMDIAGRNLAGDLSMVCAIQAALRYAPVFKPF